MSRFKRGARATALALGLATSIGLAFFVGSFLADGSHQGQIGSGGGSSNTTLPVKVNFADNLLTPTHIAPITAEVENTTAKTVTFHHLTATVTPSAPGCKASWFIIRDNGAANGFWNAMVQEGKEKTITAAAGTHALTGAEGEAHLLIEIEETGTSQEVCEGTSVTVALHLS